MNFWARWEWCVWSGKVDWGGVKPEDLRRLYEEIEESPQKSSEKAEKSQKKTKL